MKVFHFCLAAVAAVPAVALPLGGLANRAPEPADTLHAPTSAGSKRAKDHAHHHAKHKHTTTTMVNSIVSTSDASTTTLGQSTETILLTLTPTSSAAPIPSASVFGAISTSSSASAPSAVLSPSEAPAPASTTATSAEVSTTPAAGADPASPANDPTPSGVLRGVNIGNWLILEKFMDDGSVFKGDYASAVDQWSFDSLDKGGNDIKEHWDTWFTESDVKKLASYGFNALRIPIGYWAFDNSGTPYNTGAADYLDKAIGWARNANMKVLVDCHGSPGSQNGQDHSGHEGAVDWQQDNNLEVSTSILQQMVQRYGTKENSDVVFGLEIVNEPKPSAPNSFSTSQSWATDAYTALQQTISENGLNPYLQVITHDSFMGPTKFVPLVSKVTSPVDKPTFGVDQHNYQLYTDTDNDRDQPAHIQDACSWSDALSKTKPSMPVIVGEWSALTNICVKSDGTTYGSSSCDGSGNCATCPTNTWSPALVEQVRKYVEAQLDTFEANSNGHFIWNFKAGSNSGWSVYDLIEAKAFPSTITDRQYPPQCSS